VAIALESLGTAQTKGPKVLVQARSLEPDKLEVLANHLVYGPPSHTALVSSALAFLNPSLVPDADAVEQFAPRAADEIRDLALFIIALDQTQQTDPVKAFREQSLKEILSCWPSVVKWMAHFVRHASGSSGQEPNAILPCTLLLTATCSGADTDPYRAEISSLSATSDLIYLLLCLTDPRTGLYWTIPSPKGPCRIANLFAVMRQSEEGWIAMGARLKCMHQSTRRSFFSALALRVRELVSTTEDRQAMYGTVRSLAHLITGTLELGFEASLWGEIRRHTVRSLSSSLFDLGEKAETQNIGNGRFWECLAACIVSLVNASVTEPSSTHTTCIARLIEGGIYDVAAICLPHLMNAPEANLVSALESMLPLFYLSRVGHAAVKQGQGDQAWTTSLQDHASRKRNIASLTREYEACMEVNRLLFAKRGARPVSLCANLWVSSVRWFCLDVFV
jgi:hypothetical protein